ncbi:S8 family serine peptidase [Sabulilitoribacter arenilitoris]|uniref:S8 family serine peptidase n=1 Tax=Wocania arenilitoris TaxID=2044858 RepID=A0AAE3ERH0_9FLAO|nr:S8 family serine peptidase [Wocania arenilitoris]MCF7569327.1 S8 family serine peptidase [Wocania arenilitoris]
MVKKFLILCFFSFCFFSLAQQDAWVYLLDKPTNIYPLSNPSAFLSQKAIDRKTKHNVVIDLRDIPVNESYITALKNATGITVMAKSKWFNAVHVRGSETNINNLLTDPTTTFVDYIDFADKSLNTLKSIKEKTAFTVKDKFEVEKTFVNFTYGNTQNQVEMINADDLHIADYTGDGVTIAVLDAGFINVNTMGAFQRLRDAGNLMGGYDFVNRNPDVYANISSEHGTQVLSTMAGYILNDFVGTAPDASYYLFITEDSADENPVEESYWVEAVERADSLGVDLINTSLGYKSYAPNYPAYSYSSADLDGNTAFITKGANIAFEKGLVLINSAGNSGGSGVNAPADSQYVLSIGAVNSSGMYALFSSVGTAIQPSQKPDVVAQGSSAVVINLNNSIETSNGTSFSSPILAGGVACLIQALPNKTNAEIIQLVRESGSQYNNPDYELGYGIPDLMSAYNTTLSIGNLKNDRYISIYPNPSKEFIYVKTPLNKNKLAITFFDVLGKQVLHQLINNTNNRIDISLLSKGVYIANVKHQDRVISFKFIKH